MRPFRWALVACALALPAAAEPAATVWLPPPGSAAWRAVEFPSIERHTSWQVETLDGRPVWKAVSACAASGLALELEGIDLARTPLLSWSWRVARTPSPEDERTRAGDDFAARVYVVFPFDPERASLFERAKRAVFERLYGVRSPGPTLNYVWASQARSGERWQSPYGGEGAMLALRSGVPDDPGWRHETVDLAAELERLPAPPRGPAAGLALMTDSDDSCSGAEAEYADFRFHAGPIE